MNRLRLQIIAVALCLAIGPMSLQASRIQEDPSASEMAVDLLVARPVGIVILGLGTVAFVATLPFSLLGGNMLEAGDTLVVQPAKGAFLRCLGCSESGRKERLSD